MLYVLEVVAENHRLRPVNFVDFVTAHGQSLLGCTADQSGWSVGS